MVIGGSSLAIGGSCWAKGEIVGLKEKLFSYRVRGRGWEFDGRD